MIFFYGKNIVAVIYITIRNFTNNIFLLFFLFKHYLDHIIFRSNVFSQDDHSQDLKLLQLLNLHTYVETWHINKTERGTHLSYVSSGLNKITHWNKQWVVTNYKKLEKEIVKSSQKENYKIEIIKEGFRILTLALYFWTLP